MESRSELEKALGELKRITGISLTVSAGTPEEEKAAIAQIRCLCTAYKEKYNKTDFLYSLMVNGIPSYDIHERAARLHIAPDEKRVLFLLEAKVIDETVTAILKNLSPRRHVLILSLWGKPIWLFSARSKPRKCRFHPPDCPHNCGHSEHGGTYQVKLAYSSLLIHCLSSQALSAKPAWL